MKCLKGNNIHITAATIADYPTIQNMARFYVYDLSRECGHISADWALPENGLYESFDFKSYFEDPSRKAFVVKVYDELAGFVLLNKEGTSSEVEYNMGEFFIIAKFQGTGIAAQVAQQIWQMHQGVWEVSVIPENKRALSFWRRTINDFCKGRYTEEIKLVDYDHAQPRRYIFNFDTKISEKAKPLPSVRKAASPDVDAMVALSRVKRLAYSKAQPQFWKYARDAEQIQNKWFYELLGKDDYIMLVSENHGAINGFIIGRIINPPEVYDAGLTIMVDDFCVANEDWPIVGGQLIAELKTIAKQKGAGQLLVVCGSHDASKRKFLKGLDLSVASEWYVGGIT